MASTAHETLEHYVLCVLTANKIANEAAKGDTKLRHLVLLCNTYDNQTSDRRSIDRAAQSEFVEELPTYQLYSSPDIQVSVNECSPFCNHSEDSDDEQDDEEDDELCSDSSSNSQVEWIVGDHDTLFRIDPPKCEATGGNTLETLTKPEIEVNWTKTRAQRRELNSPVCVAEPSPYSPAAEEENTSETSNSKSNRAAVQDHLVNGDDKWKTSNLVHLLKRFRTIGSW